MNQSHLVAMVLTVVSSFYACNVMAITMTPYSFVEYYAYGGSGGSGGGVSSSHESVARTGSAATSGGVGGNAHATAEISTDSSSATYNNSGEIHFKTKAQNDLSDGVKIGWWVQLPGASFYYEPTNWGESTVIGYLRTVWKVVPTDDENALSVGDPVSRIMKTGHDGTFSVGNDSDPSSQNSLRIAYMVHASDDPTAWFNAYPELEGSEYLTFSGFDDLHLTADLEYNYNNSENSSLDVSKDVTYSAKIGDEFVLEMLLEADSYLLNGGTSHFARADFSTTIHALLTTDTPGAKIVQVTNSGLPVPEPTGLFLFASGLIGLFRANTDRLRSTCS